MKAYVRLFLVSTFILSATLSQATEIPAGAVSGTWTKAGSPYNINGNIKIEVTDQLVIESGVVVNFTGHYVFEVFGRLQAVGLSGDSITFTAPDPAVGWQGIRFTDTGTNGLDSTRFTFCIIEHGLAKNSGGYSGAGGAIYCIASPDIVIRNCLIRNNYAENSGVAIFLNESSNILIVNSVIEGNECDYNGGGIGTIFHNNPVLKNVIIRNNRAGQFGGGIYTQFDSSPLLFTSTITDNVAGFAGGGMYFLDSIPVFSMDDLSSIYDNRAPLGSDLYSTMPMTIALDTFTVNNPTNFIASPVENFSFTISHPLYAQVNADLYVSPSGNDDNDGLSAGSPLKTIRHAQRIIICDDQNPNTIFLGAGTFSPSTNGEMFPVYGISNLTIQGDGRTTTILDAEQEGNIFSVYDTRNVAVKSLTIENGLQEPGKGGGVFARHNAALLLNDMIIRNNKAYQGGGIYAYEDVSLVLEDVDVNDNNGAYGGGLYAEYNTSVHLDNVTFSQDSSIAYGGGMYIRNSILTIEASTISQNYAEYDGGGMYLNTATVMLSNFNIKNNFAGRHGGGIYSKDLSDWGPDSEIYNGTINGNIASGGYGGGLYAESARYFKMGNVLIHNNSSAGYGAGIYALSSYDIDFINVTIANNTGAFSGGALYIPNVFTNIIIQNSLFWNNTPNEINGKPFQVTWSDIKGATPQSWFGEGCIDTDPMFINPAGGNFALSWTSYPTIDASKSPCIDTGDPQFISIDPDGTRSDMGYQHFPQNVDFHLKDLSAPSIVSSDSNIYISFTIENLGLSSGHPDTTLVYLSDDSVLSEDDSLLSVFVAGYIPAAGDTVVQDTLTVATDIQEGEYYLIAAADIYNRV
ncbi:MAG: right-handed parallel beta-helix repeat-containing protein, partial [Bacteroidales bacterium]|nr:right-handed parallel beta-helix repeat-containing protein [Bacteroidales bacterium]